ncbi:hypothetical protein GCM10008025_36640 [Ornithinibacillus halotolerans]|uniref:Streptomycin adenylyltransferase n=1 Tax=Ornithinibacillus halotolerans TaxID=1274357 RepID=A0A916SAI1_9BACI|nr:hypothetical protein GCM10008025_36640 [Ornithinibacillus halotolerans]
MPQSRQKLLDAIQRDLLGDDKVLAFFYGGSIGNENTDVFSDIDLRIVVKQEYIKDFITNKNKRAKSWGDVLYFEDLYPSSIYTVAHYSCFVKVDIFYYTLENIKPSTWLQNIKIVKDTNGRLADTLAQSMALTYKPTVEEFEIWRTKFFAYLHEAYRRAMRGEYYYALNCIDKLRLSMCTAWYMISGKQPNTFGDWAKYEGSRSELENWQLSLLDSWECNRDPVEMLKVMKSIVPEFKKAHHILCEKLEVHEDSEWINTIVNMV